MKSGKTHFRKALKENMKLAKLSGDDGRYKANAAVDRDEVKKEVKEDIGDKLGDAFDSLAMAATAKSDTMDMMAKSIAELTESVANLTKANRELTEQLKKATAGKRTNPRNGGKGGGGAPKAQQQSYPDWCDPSAYCWTCGYKVRKDHNSKTCKFRENPGHKQEATRQNPMGGSMVNAGFGNAPNGTERK